MIELDKAKTEYNAKAVAAMQDFLRSKSWVEKIRSIERMNEADKTAKKEMRKTLADRDNLLPQP